MTFPKLSGFIYFSKTFPGLEIAVLKFHDFSRFFMTRTLKLGQSVASSQLHTCRISNQPHPLIKLPSSPSVPSRRPKYPNFSPAILQHALLIQSPHTFSKQSIPHSYQHSHTSSTHLSLQASSPLHSSRLE